MGVRTLQLDDRPVEVWYPVEPTAVEGQSSEIFDSINAISEVLRPLIPGDLGGEVDTGTYRDAPPATDGGPFPTAAYSHGSPGYRQAATFLTGHLASHGVITIAVEHLGRSLSTLLTPLAGADTPEDDVADLLDALDLVGSDPGLGSVVDTSRMVVIGHSAGARTAALATADDRVVGVALLAGVPQELASNRPALMVAFENDALIDPAGIWSLHQSLDNSVFVNIAGTGHAAPIDACPLIQDRGGLTELREALGEAIVRAGEDGCLPKDTDARAVQDLLRIYITGFVYEALGLSTGPVNLTAEAADLVAGVELRGFNEPPPDVPGTLLSSEAVDIGNLGVAWRVIYRSTSVEGDPIEVTGIIAAPAGDAPGPRPVLSVAHGTTGMADECAPSLSFPDEFSIAVVAPFLERGWVVVATDYEGMGGPGIHPYVVGESEARGVFDIVRAAQSMPGVGADGPLVVWGHSQGGHAAMHVAERWQDLAPDLDLVGVAAGAPPSQFALLSAFLQGSDYQGYLVMAAVGMAATYDDLDLAAVFNPDYFPLLDELEKGCTGHIFDVFNEIPYSELVSVDDIFAIPDWNARLIQNDTNQLPNQVPVIILHGDVDEQIPVVSSLALFSQLCAFADHAPLERRVYEGENHGSVVPAYLDDLVTWLEARVAGEPAADQCGS